MSLSIVNIQNEYRTFRDNIPRDFLIPLLKEAVSYKRAVGFFSSSSLVQISYGVFSLAERKGKIDIIASPNLSCEDIQSILLGYKKREEVIRESLLRSLDDPKTQEEKVRLNLLANLISDGILDIRIAFTKNSDGYGMYHEKMGIIEDAEGNRVVFSGSMNESATGMISNYESIDVFCSWNSWDQQRVKAKVSAFHSIWDDFEPGIKTVSFPDINEAILSKYRYCENYEKNIDESFISEVEREYVPSKKNIPRVPDHFTLYTYQVDAIRTWENNDYRGIFDMATGTGKTYTGIVAITRLVASMSGRLAVIIVCPYQHLVEQWVEDLVKFNIEPIIGYSASRQSDWKYKLERAIFDQKINVRGTDFFCFICTNATFASEFVQTQLSRIAVKKCLLVDEAHNFGADYLSKLLFEYFDYRLALSATLDRHNDEEGTEKLYNFFGEKCIEYSLEQAINEHKLCKYKYHPIVVCLTENELENYHILTVEIGKCIIKSNNGKTKLSDRGKRLALERAQLIAGAQNKIDALEEHIKQYLDDKHILVYCGATKELKDYEEFSDIDDIEIRQIDKVTDLLGNKLGMNVSQFTSRENIEEREILKREFDKGESLQVLIAIKCLVACKH